MPNTVGRNRQTVRAGQFESSQHFPGDDPEFTTPISVYGNFVRTDSYFLSESFWRTRTAAVHVLDIQKKIAQTDT